MGQMKFQLIIGRLYFGLTKENKLHFHYLLKDGNRPFGIY